MNEQMQKQCYELYKLDWLKSHITPEMLFSVFCQYLLERAENEDVEDEYTFDEYIFDYGFGEGSIYVCFEEFMDAEFADEEYMKKLLNGREDLMKAYLDGMSGDGIQGKTVYICSICGSEFTCESEDDFYEYGEETLWGHIQIDHPEVYKECQTWETPDMLDVYYKAITPGEYTIENCPFCDSEQVIFAKGITACPDCGKPLAPCSMCEECNYETCPYGCTGGPEDEFKKVTNPPISKELAEEIYKLL